MGRPPLLFLAHRIPYPPDKGEKIRAWHMLEHLARDWTVDLGCLLDDPADSEHLAVLRGCWRSKVRVRMLWTMSYFQRSEGSS